MTTPAFAFSNTLFAPVLRFVICIYRKIKQFYADLHANPIFASGCTYPHSSNTSKLALNAYLFSVLNPYRDRGE